MEKRSATAAILLVGLAGCSSTAATSHTPTTATQAVGHTSVHKPHKATSKPVSGRYTDAQTGMTATVLKVATDTTGQQYFRPKSGHFWEELDVAVRNGSKKPADYNEFDFKLVDNKGQEYNPTVYLANLPSLNSGKIPAGETRSGWLGFEVPKNSKTLTVTWGDAFNLDPPAELAKYVLH